MGIPVDFLYADAKARKVSLVGDFNQWDPTSHRMIKRGALWFVRLRLTPGRYRYLFLVDQVIWKEDPDAFLSEDSHFQGRNSVIIVE
jgi:1,4-alpha-glucan branching enzyme